MIPLLVAAASATVPDLYGMGTRSQGAGTGGLAWVNDPTAAYTNPAALGRIRRPVVTLGFSTALHQMQPTPSVWWDTNRDGFVDERDPPLELDSRPPPATGIQLHMGRHLGGTWGIGVTAYIPTNNLILFEMFEPSLPHWVMYENRLQRLVAAVGVGGKLVPGIHIGAGANLLARADVTAVATIDAELVAAEENGELEDLVGNLTIDGHTILFRVKPAVAPILAVQLEPGDWHEALTGLSAAFTFHGGTGFDIDAELDLQANVSVDELGDLEPIRTALVFQTQLAMLDHFVPPRYGFGLTYARGQAFSLYADLRYADWSRYRLNVANISNASLQSPLVQFDDEIVDGNPYTIDIRNTITLRGGTELTLPRTPLGKRLQYLATTVRAGVAWEQTPIRAQSAATSLLDGDRTGLTLGLGFETWEPTGLVDGPMRLDLFGQLHLLSQTVLERASDEPIRGYPVQGDTIVGAGRVVVFGASYSLAY